MKRFKQRLRETVLYFNVCFILATLCQSPTVLKNLSQTEQKIIAKNKMETMASVITWNEGSRIIINNKLLVTTNDSDVARLAISAELTESTGTTFQNALSQANSFRSTLDMRTVSETRLPTEEDLNNLFQGGALKKALPEVDGVYWLNNINTTEPYAPTLAVNGDNTLYEQYVQWPSYEKANDSRTACITVAAGKSKRPGLPTRNYTFSEPQFILAISPRPTKFEVGTNFKIYNGETLYKDKECTAEVPKATINNLATTANASQGWKYNQVRLDFERTTIAANGDCRPVYWPIPGYTAADGINNQFTKACSQAGIGSYYYQIPTAPNRKGAYAISYIKTTEAINVETDSNWYTISAAVPTTCTGAKITEGIAAIRPVATLNVDSILFASKASTQQHAVTSTLPSANTRIVKNLDNTETDGYKLTVNDPNMSISGFTNNSAAGNVESVKGNKIILKPGATTIKLKMNTTGSGESAPSKIAAYTTDTNGSALFGEIGTVSNNTSDVTLDLSNIMDTSIPGSKTISLYAEQENGAYKTDYMSEAYDITLAVPVDQTLGLKKDSVLTGTYGDELTLTAIVNEDKVNRQWEHENDLTASIPDTYKDIAEITSQIWDKDKGQTEIKIKPLKSGEFKLKLYKKDNVDSGITVTNNNVETAITIEKRNVTLTAKTQKFTKYEAFKPPEIEASYTYPEGTADTDKTKEGLVEGDVLPLSGGNAITVKTKNKQTLVEQAIPTKQVASVERLWTAGTWKQEVDLTEYNNGHSPLLEKYNFTPGSATDYVVEDALTPSDADIKITPDCDYKDDTECWNKGTVTIEPSDAAKAKGYTQIKDTTKEADRIDQSEANFVNSFTVSTTDITKLEDILYNLRNPDKDLFSNQGTVGRYIRIDTTAPTTIDAEISEIPVIKALEQTLKETVAMAGGNASGIRFNKVSMEVKVTATDEESGIREIKAYTFNETGDSTEELTITPVVDEFVKNDSVPGSGSTTDQNITYRTKVYKIPVNANYKNSIKIVAINNAGLTSEQVTNKIVYEDDTKAKESMVLEAGTNAKTLAGADGPFKITNDELQEADIKWPMKIQASYSGIKKISYYITDTENKPLDGEETNPIDVTTTGYGVIAPSADLSWKSVDPETLDVAVHDEAVVSLKKAIEAVKDQGAAIVVVHAKLESNAGNILEKEFVIQALYQKIEWSEKLQEDDKDKVTPDIEVEETYGNRLTLSANMVDDANRWSSTGDFTISLAEADETKAMLLNPTMEAYQTTKNASGTEKGKVTVELVPLTGNDTEVTLIAKKFGDTEYADSNEIKVKVKLKSKPITVEADANTTYDVKTGEVHPKLTYKITDADKKENDDALVKDTDAQIDDTATDKKVDFLLKATSCVDPTDCKIASLLDYEQETQRINEIGEWKLEFQYKKDEKTGDTKENIFNRKYDITFVDYSHPIAAVDTSKTLKVTQDSFGDTWYTITPEPEAEVIKDRDAWNKSTITIQPTDQAMTTDTKKRTYNTIINDDLETTNAPDTWAWVNDFTHEMEYSHDTEKGTDPKTYKLRFRDPDTGAFTAQADAKRSVRVDETAPIKPFISVNKDNEIPVDSAVAESGAVQGIRFSKDGLNITVSMIDEESGMRSLKVYTVEKGTETEVTTVTITDEESTEVPSVNQDGKKAVRKKTGKFTISEEFKGNIKIVGMNNAGLSTTYETGELINEPETGNKLSIAADDKNIPEKITRSNYDESFAYPLEFKAPISGIKKIEYTMSVEDDQTSPKKTLKSDSADIMTELGVVEVNNVAAVNNSPDENTPTYEIGQIATAYGDYFSIKPYIDAMINEKTDLGTIKINIKLTSNAGNVIETETQYTLPVDLMLNDAQSYLVVPKQVRLQRVKDQDIAQGIDEVKLKTITEDEKPAGLDITQYFNVYTNPKITLDKVNDESGRKHTFEVSVYDDADNKLTADKNLLASLNYPTNTTSKFTLTTPLVKNPEKDKDGGEYRGTMKYEVKYGKQDNEKKPVAEVKP